MKVVSKGLGSELNNKISDQVIALAALLQACHLVDQLSKTGQIAPEHLNPLINSLFEFNPKNTESIYSGTLNIRPGLQLLEDILVNSSAGRYGKTLHYAMSVLYLGKKLQSNEEMLAIIRNRLEHASFGSTHFSASPDDVANSVAGIYQDTLSTFKYRIQVTGSIRFLNEPQVAQKVRALLFSAVRAAILWRQLGGSRLKLLLQRKKYLKTTRQLMQTHGH